MIQCPDCRWTKKWLGESEPSCKFERIKRYREHYEEVKELRGDKNDN